MTTMSWYPDENCKQDKRYVNPVCLKDTKSSSKKSLDWLQWDQKRIDLLSNFSQFLSCVYPVPFCCLKLLRQHFYQLISSWVNTYRWLLIQSSEAQFAVTDSCFQRNFLSLVSSLTCQLSQHLETIFLTHDFCPSNFFVICSLRTWSG